MKKNPKIIVLTGAESTGKTTLTVSLARHFNVPYIPEIAREVVENLGRQYNYDDVEQIAKKQLERYEELMNSSHPYIFIDTWLLNTKVWFQEVFSRIPAWLDESIRNSKIDLFVVCDVDLPWEYDPVRENGGYKRVELHKKYIEEINYYNFRYKIISGQNDKRQNEAMNAILQL